VARVVGGARSLARPGRLAPPVRAATGSVVIVDTDANAEDEPAGDDDGELTEAGDGVVAEADDFEITEADREIDRNLAIQLVAAFFAGALTLYGVVPGALATMFAPALAAIMTSLARVGQRRAEHAADTLMDAADAADVPLDEFFSRAVADDRRQELFTRTLIIAQDTALREKRRALGRALAAGVMGDDAQIDEELLFIKAVEDIDMMHIRLLDRIATAQPAEGWMASTIVAADRGLANGIRALLGTLELHGLIAARVSHGIRVQGPQETRYDFTDSGRRFLSRLADDSD
jgi:hypothetical protein